MTYREARAGRLPAVIWSDAGEVDPKLVVPDGCMDLLWDGTGLRIAGPDRVAFHAGADEVVPSVGVRFDPGVAPSFFGVSAEAVAGERVDLADVWDAAVVDRWVATVAASPDAGAALEDLLSTTARPVPPWVAEAVRRLDGGASVAAVADGLGVTPRHLARLCRARFGYGPKVLARILRFQHALAGLRSGADGSWVAASSGYADYSHLFRDVRDLTGVSPSELQVSEA